MNFQFVQMSSKCSLKTWAMRNSMPFWHLQWSIGTIEMVICAFPLKSRDEKSYKSVGFVNFSGHEEIVEILIDAGADVNLVEKDGLQWSVLHWAAFLGNFWTVSLSKWNSIKFFHFPNWNVDRNEVVKKLIQKGANIHLKNSQGQTARKIANFRGYKISQVEIQLLN